MCIVGLTKRVNRLMLLEAKNSQLWKKGDRRTYGLGKGKDQHCGIKLEQEISLLTHDF
jgi:hypothetical protein